MVEIIGVAEPSVSTGLGPQVVEAMSNVREATYPACSFPTSEFRELLNEHEPTHQYSFLDSVDLVRSNRHIMFEVVWWVSTLIMMS